MAMHRGNITDEQWRKLKAPFTLKGQRVLANLVTHGGDIFPQKDGVRLERGDWSKNGECVFVAHDGAQTCIKDSALIGKEDSETMARKLRTPHDQQNDS